MGRDLHAPGWSWETEGRARASRHQSFSARVHSIQSESSGGFSAEAFTAGLLERSAQSFNQKELTEIQSLSHEADAEMFFTGMLQFGQRLQDRGKLELAAEVYAAIVGASACGGRPHAGTDACSLEGLHTASLQAGTHMGVPLQVSEWAQKKLDTILGKGSAGLRAEVLIRGFAEAATDYRMILPLIAGSVVGQTVRAATLSRFATARATWLTRGLNARFAAGFAGYAAEVPVFAMSARLLAGPNGSTVSQDLQRAALTLGALKVFGYAGNQGFLKLHGFNELAVPTRLHGLARVNRVAIPQASLFLGLMGSHHLEAWAGLRPQVDGATTATDTLATMVSLGVGSHLGHRLLGPRFAAFQAELAGRTSDKNVGAGLVSAPLARLFGKNPNYATSPQSGRTTMPRHSSGVSLDPPLQNLPTSLMPQHGEGGGRGKKPGEDPPARAVQQQPRTTARPVVIQEATESVDFTRLQELLGRLHREMPLAVRQRMELLPAGFQREMMAALEEAGLEMGPGGFFTHQTDEAKRKTAKTGGKQHRLEAKNQLVPEGALVLKRNVPVAIFFNESVTRTDRGWIEPTLEGKESVIEIEHGKGELPATGKEVTAQDLFDFYNIVFHQGRHFKGFLILLKNRKADIQPLAPIVQDLDTLLKQGLDQLLARQFQEALSTFKRTDAVVIEFRRVMRGIANTVGLEVDPVTGMIYPLPPGEGPLPPRAQPTPTQAHRLEPRRKALQEAKPAAEIQRNPEQQTAYEEALEMKKGWWSAWGVVLREPKRVRDDLKKIMPRLTPEDRLTLALQIVEQLGSVDPELLPSNTSYVLMPLLPLLKATDRLTLVLKIEGPQKTATGIGTSDGP